MRLWARAPAALLCGLAAATLSAGPAQGAGSASAHRAAAHSVRHAGLRVHRVRRPARRRGHIPTWVLSPGPLGRQVPGLTGGTDPAAPGDPAPATSPGASPVTPAPGGGGTTPPPSNCTGVAVGATLREWSIHLSRASVCSGTVSVQAVNYGGDPHDVWLQRTDGSGTTVTFGDPLPLAAYPGIGTPPGIETQALTLTPGTYRLFCSLVGGTPAGTPGASHDAAGMHATLTVVAP